MNSRDAIKLILGGLTDKDICLFTTGFISRIGFNVKDKNSNFYMIGSMGLVSSVGLGIAVNTRKRVFIFDGDGSVLMDMGNMANIGAISPANLFHIVLDNESYGSTGGQLTISGKIDLAFIAKAAGYRYVFKIVKSGDLKKRFAIIFAKKGPVLLLIKVKDDNVVCGGRVSIPAHALTNRIKREIGRQADD